MSGSIKQTICSAFHDTFFTYTTVKVVKVPNTFIGILNRVLQLIIFAYIALYIVWWKKGYQQFQEPRATSIIKVKGIARVTENDTVRYIRAGEGSLWDTTEYQIPPLENNAFFIATRQTITYNQTEGFCPGIDDDLILCDTTSPNSCPQGGPTKSTFGYFTGKCIPNKDNSSNVCEINAWCPEELSNSVNFTMNSDDLDSFTVFLKTMVTFNLFDIYLRNVRDDTNFSCIYDKVNNPHCPIFRIGDALNNAAVNKTLLLNYGGLIEIQQDWTCNFDYNEDLCYPELHFNVLQRGNEKPSPGVNYRYAQKYRVNDTDYRTLSKVYGIRFVVVVSGKGGQFYIVNLFVAIGSGIGFMVIAGVVCDAIFMYIHKAKERYREGKFSVCEVTEELTSPNDNLTQLKNIRTISDIAKNEDL